ncbi:uncharacterized protein K452DRAFT_285577 [Aplosporella prunicola CBS 121167]|uniref:Uncharacterized protein n=1 Tax=Aplosporella prunicola CBS 121167 TaxID=1176127 RepID=A0A6A6BP65_9PEZI|nr:uncharacterized protein K452DRAFT_285577 [Aplosporella prunicola CBS 121167]KAF2144341.1 hypothetical protein K452DRAFT_285577 [Aplosporella prunicola CBS 121167]
MPTAWETDYTETFHHHSYPAISPTRPELSAAGKTVFISGGGRGLGTGIVDAFAQAGAKILIILGRNAATLQAVAERTEAAHPAIKVHTIAGDVSREADLARAFAEVKKIAPSGIDVFVANAGVLPTITPIRPAVDANSEDTKSDDAYITEWWRGWEVNVKGVFLQARHFLATAAPNAVFLNISAGAGHINPVFPGFSAYASSKLGAARVVETLQAENPGFRFNNIQPGVVETEMLEASDILTYGLPVDDLNLPGHFLVWLASPEAEFLKGKYVWANWDVDELKARKDEISAPNRLVSGLVGWA